MSSPKDTEAEAAGKAAEATPTPALIESHKPPRHNIHSVMNFEQLISKVQEAEDALEAQERRFVADVRQLRASWRAAWTPGRIVVAGLVSGFTIGRLNPEKVLARGGGAMQLISMLSGLFATGKAQVAASDAEHAVNKVEDVAEAVAPAAVHRATRGPRP